MKKEDFFEVIGELDDNIVKGAKTHIKKKTNWKAWGAIAACFALILSVGVFTLDLWKNDDTIPDPGIAYAAQMVCVNNTLYQSLSNQPDFIGKEGQLVYLGTISSKVSSSQCPKEDFQANDDIVGSAVYQYGKNMVVEINGQYQVYAMLDVNYTANDDGTYTCRGNTFKYKIEVSGMDGESQANYIILTNNAETSFEDVRYSLIKAEMSTEIPEFVILGWYY